MRKYSSETAQFLESGVTSLGVLSLEFAPDLPTARDELYYHYRFFLTAERTLNDTPQQLFVAIDASTSSVRAVIFDARGEALSVGREGLHYERVERDGYEQDANTWWSALCGAIQSAVRHLPAERRMDICALCIAHQRETVVPTDANGQPLSPAILWMDSRCREDVAQAERQVGGVRLHALSGKPACTTPSLYKLMHLFRTRPELRDVSCVHDVHSFLSLRLTGRAISSFASADPSGLLDMRQKAWSRTLLSLVGIEAHQLPELVHCGYLIGPLLPSASSATGLPAHVLLYAGSGDGQLSGLGAGVTERGRGFLDIGTAVSCGTITDQYEIDTAFRTLHAAIPGKYCLETTLRGGMLTLWWLVEGLLGCSDRNEAMAALENQAARVAPTSEGLITLPYWTGVMNPYWDDGARGAFFGLHPGHQPAHLYRSILEGVALESRLHLEGVRQAVGRSKEELVLLGGGSRSDLWCQIFADVLSRPIRRCRTADAAALGAAVLASVAHGVYESFNQATEAMTQLGARFTPGQNAEIYDQLYREVYRGLFVDLRARSTALAKIREVTCLGAVSSFRPPPSILPPSR